MLPHPSWMYMSAKPKDIPVGPEGQASGWSASFTVPLAVLVVSDRRGAIPRERLVVGARAGTAARRARLQYTRTPNRTATAAAYTIGRLTSAFTSHQ